MIRVTRRSALPASCGGHRLGPSRAMGPEAGAPVTDLQDGSGGLWPILRLGNTRLVL
jgi:hypothetical protein